MGFFPTFTLEVFPSFGKFIIIFFVIRLMFLFLGLEREGRMKMAMVNLLWDFLFMDN